MKLGKSLIITGLLFSSILGSVNVGSITAMAAEVTAREGQIVADDNVSIEYKDQNGELITDKNFIDNTDKTVKSADISQAYDISGLKTLPDGYELAGGDKNVPVQTKSGNTHFITVKVNRKSVKVIYKDKDGNPVTSTNLLPTLSLKDPTQQITAANLDSVNGYDFSSYASGVVTFKEKVAVPEDKNITIQFTDKNNKNKKLKNGSVKVSGDAKTVVVPNKELPEGYKLVQKTNSFEIKDGPVQVLVERISSRGGHSGYVSQRVRISFIDQDGDEVGYQQLNGKASFDTKISAPAGYSFVNANEANIKFDKSGNKDLKLKVTKNRPVSTMEEGIVTTNSGDFKHLYTIDGKDITNRGLSGDSKWYTDQYATINGEKMFRVATNEWVKATDVYK